MSTGMIWQTDTTASAQTEQLAERLGSRLKGGEVWELQSDLGGGKTTFVRGLARGLGSQDHVASPTFTISREYKAGKLTLHHFDFYRLQDPGVMSTELQEFIDDPQAIVAVEWADVVENVLPIERIKLMIEVIDEDARRLTFHYAEKYEYLFLGDA